MKQAYSKFRQFGLVFGLAVLCLGRAGAQNNLPLRENYPLINRGVVEFYKTNKTSGFEGLIARINKCWTDIESHKSQNAIAFCFALDYSASTFAEIIATTKHAPQTEFTRIEKTLTRVNKALKEIKADQDKRGKLISGWVLAANAMLREYAKNDGKAARLANKSENENMFFKVRAAITDKIKEQNLLQFQSFDRLVTPNMNGEPIEVVCGKVRVQNLSSGKVVVRPFVYFVEDGTSYYDSGLPGVDDLDAYLVKNFCLL